LQNESAKGEVMLIKFTQKSQPYNCGEIAEFADNVANRLIKAGVAIEYIEKKEKPVETPKTPINKPDESSTMVSPVNRKYTAKVRR